MRNIFATPVFKKLTFATGALVLATVMLAACASPAAVPAASQYTSAPAMTKAPAAVASPATMAEAEINVANDAKLGKILVGNNGMTLYIFTKDTADTSNCNADCLKKWPPLLTEGHPVLGDGVDAAMIGTATLADGSQIVTYNHMPLYYFAKDAKAGDVTGQGVGSVWFVVGPDGNSIGG